MIIEYLEPHQENPSDMQLDSVLTWKCVICVLCVLCAVNPMVAILTQALVAVWSRVVAAGVLCAVNPMVAFLTQALVAVWSRVVAAALVMTRSNVTTDI